MRLTLPLLIGVVVVALVGAGGCASSGTTENLDNIQQQLLGICPCRRAPRLVTTSR